MKSYQAYQVDAFTEDKFTGNPAGVVTNADGLTVEQMLAIAREFNNSETAFIFSRESNDHDIRIRYFTPQVEVPICGHATIAAHYVRAIEENLGSTKVIQKTNIGNLPVEIEKKDNSYKIIMTQGTPEFSSIIDDETKEKIVLALGITRYDLDSKCPVQIVSTGHSKVMIGIKSKELLNSLTPDMAHLVKLSKILGCNGFFVFTFDTKNPKIFTSSRMFAPAIGIPEDPVTGNGHGPLGAYLVHHGLIRREEGFVEFVGVQGEKMGRKGTVEVFVKVVGSQPELVKIAGKAVVVFKTEFNV